MFGCSNRGNLRREGVKLYFKFLNVTNYQGLPPPGGGSSSRANSFPGVWFMIDIAETGRWVNSSHRVIKSTTYIGKWHQPR